MASDDLGSAPRPQSNPAAHSAPKSSAILPRLTPSLAEPRATIHQKWAIYAAATMLLVLVRLLHNALLPFVFAAALAYVASPLVRALTRWLHVRRWIAALMVFCIYTAVLAGLIDWSQSVLVPQFVQLTDSAPADMKHALQVLSHWKPLHFLARYDPDKVVNEIVASISNWLGGPAQVLAGGFAGLVTAILTVVLLLFFLLSGPRLAAGALWLVPPALRPEVMRVSARLHPVLFRYIAGVIVIVMVTSFLTWIGIGWLLGLPHAMLISVAVGILETIPVVGPACAAAILGTVAVSRGGTGTILGVALFALAMRLFIDQLLGPIILGRAVSLHPAVVLFSMIVGGMLFGILGVLLAVPAAATLKIVLQTYYEPQVLTPAPLPGIEPRPGAG